MKSFFDIDEKVDVHGEHSGFDEKTKPNSVFKTEKRIDDKNVKIDKDNAFDKNVKIDKNGAHDKNVKFDKDGANEHSEFKKRKSS